MGIPWLGIALVGLIVFSPSAWSAPKKSAAAAAPAGSRCIVTQLTQDFIGPNRELYRDFDKRTQFFYNGRLHALIRTIPNEKLKTAFADMSIDDFTKLFDASKAGATDKIAGANRSQVDQLIMDLYNFMVVEGNHGDWLKSPNLSDEFLKRLDKVDAKVGYDNSLTAAADFTDEALAVSEHQLFLRALGEYKGQKFERTATRRAWDAWRRFWFPTHKRAATILEFDRIAREKMQLEGILDKVVREQGMGKLAEHGLDKAQETALQAYLADTPAAVAQVRKSVAKVWGQELSVSRPIDVNQIDIKAIYKRVAEKFDAARQELRVQKKVEDDLDGVQELLNEARRRKGLDDRTVKDFGREELQIRYQQRQRVAGELSDQYHGATDRRSAESYTVEDQHTRQVPDGKDEKGNTKYRTEVYYTDRTVHPTYERILTGNYDRGDRGVSGLDQVKANVAQMQQSEVPFRNTISEAEEAMAEFVGSYSTSLQSPEKLQKRIEGLTQVRTRLWADSKEAAGYAEWPDARIRQQWRKDDPSDFRDRNAAMSRRFANMALHFDNVIEQATRKLASLGPEFVHPDYTAQMEFLRKKMMVAHGIKAAAGTAVLGGGAYYYSQHQEEVDAKLHRLGVALGLAEEEFRYHAPYYRETYAPERYPSQDSYPYRAPSVTTTTVTKATFPRPQDPEEVPKAEDKPKKKKKPAAPVTESKGKSGKPAPKSETKPL